MSMFKWHPGLTIDLAEKECIVQSMAFFAGNKEQTATALGIARRTLDNKLEKYALEKAAEKKTEHKTEEEMSPSERLALRDKELMKKNRYGSFGDAPKMSDEDSAYAKGIEAAKKKMPAPPAEKKK